MSPKMAVTRVVSYYARPANYSTGGVNTSRQEWMVNLASSGTDVVLVNALGGFEQQLVFHDRLTFMGMKHWGSKRVSMVPRGFRSLLAQGDLVYLHEGWTVSNVVVAVACLSRGVPYVVMPHGVYAAKIVPTLKLHRARRIIESWLASHAAAVHLFFDGELEELHRVAPKARGIVATTGFDLPPGRWEPDAGDPYIAWVGRFDILHKGLDTLLAALSAIPPGSRPRLKMCGPDYQGDKAKVVDTIEGLGLSAWIEVLEEMPSSGVLELMRRSQGFVHVPRWEAFGRTIAEALSMGVPVLLGDGAQIAESLSANDAAIVVRSDSSEQIADGLMQLSTSKAATGQRGREWVGDHLSWSTRVPSLVGQLRGLDIDLRGNA